MQLGRQNSGSSVAGAHFLQLPVFHLININTRRSPFMPVLSNRRVTAVWLKNTAPNCSFPTRVLLCVLLLNNYKNNAQNSET
jgi:hypothetical protein